MPSALLRWEPARVYAAGAGASAAGAASGAAGADSAGRAALGGDGDGGADGPGDAGGDAGPWPREGGGGVSPRSESDFSRRAATAFKLGEGGPL